MGFTWVILFLCGPGWSLLIFILALILNFSLAYLCHVYVMFYLWYVFRMTQVAEFRPNTTSVCLMKQGAEAKIYSCSYEGRPTIVKERFSKAYRHPVLDRTLTVRRTRAEAKCIQRCQNVGKCSKVVCLSVGCYVWFIHEFFNLKKLIKALKFYNLITVYLESQLVTCNRTLLSFINLTLCYQSLSVIEP